MELSLSFLGPLKVTVNEIPISESRAKKIEALLIYLVMEANVAHRRETLVGLLFPDIPDEAARTNLRQTLTRLRKAIKDSQADPSFLLTTRETTQFNLASRVSLDVRRFEALIHGCERHLRQPVSRCKECIARLESATALYRGPFLDGFYLEDSIAFEEWMFVNRERYKQLAISAFQTITNFYERRGAYGKAQRYAEQLLAIEPWDEGAFQQYARLLAYQGKRTVALAKFEQFNGRLYEELGVEPSQETTDLRDQIAAMVEKRPSNLQPHPIELIGRQNDVALILEQLAFPESRLLTLVGHGGIGKTTLATAIGWQTVNSFAGPLIHGTFFIPLAGIDENNSTAAIKAAIVTTIAEKIGYTFSTNLSPEEQLISYLKDKAMLLILDNLEHVMDASRDIINQILHQASEIKIMTTSRERLNLMLEWVHQIEGLPVPTSDQPLAELDEFGATQLFLQRAKQSNPNFHFTDEESADLNSCGKETAVKICQKLYGMPLAIELAAPLVRLMPCREILAEINQNYASLSSTMHHIPTRHQSIQAVFDSSWRLLNEDEQEILKNISVFRGGFDKQAAQQVAEANIQRLSALLDKSLLSRMEGDTFNSRFQMPEMLRQFSAAKIKTPGHPTIQTHCNYYLNQVGQQYRKLINGEQSDTLVKITAEIENIRLAWQTALQQGNIPLLATAVDTLTLFFYMRSWLTEGIELFKNGTESLKLIPTRDKETAVLIHTFEARHGWFIFLQGNQKEGVTLLEKSLAALKEHDSSEKMLFPLSYLAAANQIIGNLVQATTLANDGLSLSGTCQNRYYQAINNNILSQIAYQQGQYDIARSHGETSLQLERELDNRWSMGFSLANLGRSAYALGELDRAQTYYEESLAIRKALNDERGQAICLTYLGDTLQAGQQYTDAKQHYEEALAHYQTINSQTGLANSFIRLGQINIVQNEPAAAQQTFKQALKYAQNADATPLLLGALLGLAQLKMQEMPQQAIRLYSFIQQHSAAMPATKQHVNSLIATVDSSKLPAQDALTLEEALSFVT